MWLIPSIPTRGTNTTVLPFLGMVAVIKSCDEDVKRPDDEGEAKHHPSAGFTIRCEMPGAAENGWQVWRSKANSQIFHNNSSLLTDKRARVGLSEIVGYEIGIGTV